MNVVQMKRHRGVKETVKDLPWEKIVMGTFWGSMTALSGVLVIDFILIGGIYGVLLAVIYAAIGTMFGYMFYSVITGKESMFI